MIRVHPSFCAAALAVLGSLAAPLYADNIYVIDNGVTFHTQVQNAEAYLTNLGHTITTGNTLASYAGYDQVWDLRYDGALTLIDVAAMGAYLQGGGRMYMTGEHPGFDAQRNVSLVAFLTGVGAGTMSLPSLYDDGIAQPITVAGAVVNAPNAATSVVYGAASLVNNVSQGFLVTEEPASSLYAGYGSLVGWDFGDITGAPGARLLVAFDIEIFEPTTNGQAWTENMATYLSPTVPEPASLILAGLGFAGVLAVRRRCRSTSR